MKKILKKISKLHKKEGYIKIGEWMEKHKDSTVFFLAWSIWWRITIVSFPIALLMQFITLQFSDSIR